MNAALSPPLLAPDEPESVGIARPGAASPFVILCDHAGKRIPRLLDSLGLPRREVARHIGWDIGALGVAQGLSARLKATLGLSALFTAGYRLQPTTGHPQRYPDRLGANPHSGQSGAESRRPGGAASGDFRSLSSGHR